MTRRLYSVEVAPDAGGPTLLCASRRDVPLVSVAIECPGGHLCNPHHRPGLADITAALFNEGPQGQPPLEWHRRLENDAISMSIYPSLARWVAHVDCLSSDLDRALDLFEAWLARPGFPATEWKRLVKSFRASAKEQWAQPIGVIDSFSSVQVLGYGHPMAHPPFEKSFAQVRYQEACQLGRSAFRREQRTCGLIGGDIDVDEGFERLRRLLAALPAGESAPAPEPLPSPAAKRVWILDHPHINQVFFVLARSGSRASDPDRVALRLADYALGGGGFGSRLMKRVRSEMGHTYGIHSSLPLEHLLGPFQIQSFTQTGNLEAMLDLIEGELDAIRSTGFAPEEVEDAREHLHGALPLRLTNPDVILRTVADGLLAGLTVEDLEADWAAIRQTSLDQVNQAARRLIGDQKFHLALIGPAREILPQLKNRGETAVFNFRTPPDRWQDRG